MDSILNCKILIVDDEPELCRMVTTILQKEGFKQTITAADCNQARQSLQEEKPDCVVLDVSLPDGDGFTLLRELRTESAVPVLFLSAHDEDQARMLGLGLGADDYITKPFLPLELVLRIKAILNRTYFLLDKSSGDHSRFFLGEIEVDLDSGVVVKADGMQCMLTAKEFALLKKLYDNAGKIVTIDSLCHAAWGENIYRYENTLMVHMRRLREKIEPDPSAPRYLLTVRGLGYKLGGVKDSR